MFKKVLVIYCPEVKTHSCGNCAVKTHQLVFSEVIFFFYLVKHILFIISQGQKIYSNFCSWHLYLGLDFLPNSEGAIEFKL